MTRRHALRALARGLGGLSWLPRRAAAGDAARLGFGDLYRGGGPLGLAFSETLLRLRGRPVAMRGFMAPPLKAEARFFVLTARPVSLCPFCDSDASWPHDIVVVHLRPGVVAPFRSSGDALEVTGLLEVGSRTNPDSGFVSQVRIVEATARPL